MDAAVALGDRDDESLAALVAAADEDAFAVLYRRHFDPLFDFVARMLRDRDAAADVVQMSFVRAYEKLRSGKAVTNVRAWLYAIARNAAVDELRRRKRTGADTLAADSPEFAVAGPETGVAGREIVELVWSAAAALSPGDRALLDLHLRHDLGADELSAALGLRKGAVYTRLSRLKDSLEESVVCLVLVRRGRSTCAGLDRIVEDAGAVIGPALRRRIRAHLRICEKCEDTRRRLASPVEIFAGLVAVPIPPAVRAEAWDRIRDRIDRREPTPKSALRRAMRSLAAKLVALAVVVAGGGLGISRLGSESHIPVRDPPVDGISHDVGDPSTRRIVVVGWPAQSDVSGYSVMWTRRSRDLPDTTVDLPGTATRAVSPELGDGSWWFHLRTRGAGGDWTATVHLGPFVIVPGEAGPGRSGGRDRRKGEDRRRSGSGRHARDRAGGPAEAGSPPGSEPPAGTPGTGDPAPKSPKSPKSPRPPQPPGPTPTQPGPTPTQPGPTPTQPGPTPTQPGPSPTQPSPTPTRHPNQAVPSK